MILSCSLVHDSLALFGVDVIEIDFLLLSTTRGMVVGWFLLLSGFMYEV
jgi:hypothetical protein